MKLKLNDDGSAVVQDGKPVYISDDGKETTFDPIQMRGTISRLGDEAKTNREKLEAAETKLKPFANITDPEAAAKALETVANLDNKKLIDAGEAEKVRAEIAKSYEEKLAEKDKTITSQGDELRKEKIGGQFGRSKFISDKLTIAADMTEAMFGKNFKLEEGNVVAYDNNGNPIYSPNNAGEKATFDEALEIMVGVYANKDNILKGANNSGSGSDGGNGGGGAGTMTRKEFDALDPTQRAAKAADMSSGKLTLTD